MGKQKGRNAFFFYLLHTQNQMKTKGKNYGINDRILHELANETWKDMSKEDRAPFEEKSRHEKERLKGRQQIQIQPKSYNERQENFGRVLTEESVGIDDESGREEYYDKMIECCVKACTTTEDMINASFFIIASNVMVMTDDRKYLPLELGICQYSIKNGISFTYHEFIDPGGVPMGYMRLAKEFCESSHRIPLENFLPAVNNYEKIVEDIKEILDNSRFTNEVTGSPTPMMVFCREDQIDQNKGVLEFLANKYRATVPHFEWDVEVLDLVNLLFHISNSVDKRIVPAVGEDLLSSSAFDYADNTLCGYHEDLDNRNCAQGVARKLSYILSQTLCPMFDINPTQNHLPSKRQNVISETYTATLSDAKPLPAWRYQHNPNSDSGSDWEPSRTQPKAESSTARPQFRRPMGIGRGLIKK